MTDDRTADLRRRLAAGEWLKAGEVAALFSTTRQSVDRWLRNGVVIGGYRRTIEYRTAPSGHRLIDPEVVTQLLAAYDRRQSAELPPDEG